MGMIILAELTPLWQSWSNFSLNSTHNLQKSSFRRWRIGLSLKIVKTFCFVWRNHIPWARLNTIWGWQDLAWLVEPNVSQVYLCRYCHCNCPQYQSDQLCPRFIFTWIGIKWCSAAALPEVYRLSLDLESLSDKYFLTKPRHRLPLCPCANLLATFTQNHC